MAKVKDWNCTHVNFAEYVQIFKDREKNQPNESSLIPTSF